jgi:creatinine amidohydrolase
MPEWSSLTYEEIGELAQQGLVAVLPVGATEQHGPQLGTGTDAVLADAAVRAAVRQTGDLALPVLSYGCSLGHTDQWPGTLSLSATTLTAMVMDIGRWVHASGFRKLVMVNSHATNGPPCQSALLELRHQRPDLRLRFVSLFDVTPQAAEGYLADADDPHANEAETSLLLHVAPDLVHMDRVVDEEDRTLGRVLQYAMPQVTTSGVVGRPSESTADRGERLFATVVAGLVDLLARARAEEDPLPGRSSPGTSA